MRVAEDFRKIAREVLNGKWMIAVVVGLVATILGAGGDAGMQFKVNIDAANANLSLDYAGQTIVSTGGGLRSPIGAFIVTGFGYIMTVLIIMAIIRFVLGGFVGVGYAKFNLNLVDRKETSFNTLFAYFDYWKTTTVAKILRGIYTFFWTLLFIVPGILAKYSYSMTDYILADNPELTASEAIEQSKSVMYGNRWRLFCLEFSFIGWNILAALTLGIGRLWLIPYKQAAYAMFYREVSGTEYSETDEIDYEIN